MIDKFRKKNQNLLLQNIITYYSVSKHCKYKFKKKSVDADQAAQFLDLTPTSILYMQGIFT